MLNNGFRRLCGLACLLGASGFSSRKLNKAKKMPQNQLRHGDI